MVAGLRLVGGYVRSIDSYSLGAARVPMPHIEGGLTSAPASIACLFDLYNTYYIDSISLLTDLHTCFQQPRGT